MNGYITSPYITQSPGVNTLTTFGEYPSTSNTFNNGLNSSYNLGTKPITKLAPVTISAYPIEPSSGTIPLYNNVSIPQSQIVNTTNIQLSPPIYDTGSNLVNLQNNNLGQYQTINTIGTTGVNTQLIPSINILPTTYSGFNDLNTTNTTNLSSYPVYSVNSNNLVTIPNQQISYDINNNLGIANTSPINSYYLNSTPTLVSNDNIINNIGVINSNPYNYSSVPLQQMPVLVNSGVSTDNYTIFDNNQITQNYGTELTSTDFNAQVQNLLNSNPTTSYEQSLNGYQISYTPNVNINRTYETNSFEPEINIKSSYEIPSKNINYYDSIQNGYTSEPFLETQNLINSNYNEIENKNTYSYRYSEPIPSSPVINSLNEINYNFNEISGDTYSPLGNMRSEYSLKSIPLYTKPVIKNITLPPKIMMPKSEVDYIPVKRRSYIARTKTKVFVPSKKTVIVPKITKVYIPTKKTIYVKSPNRSYSTTAILSPRQSFTNDIRQSFSSPLYSSYSIITHQVPAVNYTVRAPLSPPRYNIESVEVSSPLRQSNQYEIARFQTPLNKIIYPPKKYHVTSHNG